MTHLKTLTTCSVNTACQRKYPTQLSSLADEFKQRFSEKCSFLLKMTLTFITACYFKVKDYYTNRERHIAAGDRHLGTVVAANIYQVVLADGREWIKANSSQNQKD